MKGKLRVLFLATTMIFGLTLSGQAAGFKLGDADFNLGGSLRYDVGYQFNDLGDQPLVDPDAVPGDLLYGVTYPEDSNTDFFCDDPGDSRVNLMAKYGQVTGFVEFGFGSSVVKRHAYLSYDFGGGNSLLVGHTWSILAMHFPNQPLNNDDCLIGFGNLYSGRNPQVRFTHQGPISYTLAIEDNDSTTPGVTTANYIQNQLTPKLLASLTFKNKLLWVTPSVVWQSVEMKGNAYGAPLTGLVYDDIEVDAWALALDGGFTFEELNKVGFEYALWYGQNTYIIADNHEMRPATRGSILFGAPVADLLGTGIEDVNSMGGWAQLSIPVNPVTVCVGYGYQESEVVIANPLVEYKYEDEISTSAMFINAKYNITPQFYVQPELVYYDFGKAAQKIDRTYGPYEYLNGDNDLGGAILAGVHFRYNF